MHILPDCCAVSTSPWFPISHTNSKVNTLSHLDITKGGTISRANSFKAFLLIFSCEKNLEGNPGDAYDNVRYADWKPLCDSAFSVFKETADDLKALIVYCRAVSIKPWSWKRQRQTTVSEMFSLGEVSAIRHCKDSPRGA